MLQHKLDDSAEISSSKLIFKSVFTRSLKLTCLGPGSDKEYFVGLANASDVDL